MKNLILALALIISASAQAQTAQVKMKSPTPEHSFGVGLEPHWLILGGLGARMDARVSEKVSMELGGMYIPPRQNIRSSDSSRYYEDISYKWSVYEVYLGTRVMLLGDYDTHGLFLAPAVGYTGASITDYGTSKLSASLNMPELRITTGYQFIVKDFRFTTGAGWRVMQSSDVVIKDDSGEEVYREKSNALNGLVLDLQVGYLF